MLPLRSAIKSLRRSPGFATVSILSLALALGLVAAVFGIVDALRNPVTATFEPERLVAVRMKGEGASGRITAADHMEACANTASVSHSAQPPSGSSSTCFMTEQSSSSPERRSAVSSRFWTKKFVDPYIGMMFYIDVWALVAAEFVLVAVAMLAMMRPAVRATKSDPVEVLRSA